MAVREAAQKVRILATRKKDPHLRSSRFKVQTNTSMCSLTRK